MPFATASYHNQTTRNKTRRAAAYKTISPALQLDGVPGAVDVAEPRLGVVDGEEGEARISRIIPVLAEGDHVLEALLADLRAGAVFQVRAAPQDDPAAPGLPGGQLHAGIGLHFAVAVLGGGGAELDLAVLQRGEAEGAHVGLGALRGILHRGEVPGGDAGEVVDDKLVSGHFGVLSRECGLSAWGWRRWCRAQTAFNGIAR